jgi:hypothetical protein
MLDARFQGFAALIGVFMLAFTLSEPNLGFGYRITTIKFQTLEYSTSAAAD